MPASDIIRRLEQEQRDAKQRAERAEAEAAEFRRKEAALSSALGRAKLPAPPGDVCPECWLVHGVESPLDAIAADDPRQYDRMRCRECGYYEDREFR